MKLVRSWVFCLIAASSLPVLAAITRSQMNTLIDYNAHLAATYELCALPAAAARIRRVTYTVLAPEGIVLWEEKVGVMRMILGEPELASTFCRNAAEVKEQARLVTETEALYQQLQRSGIPKYP